MTRTSWSQPDNESTQARVYPPLIQHHQTPKRALPWARTFVTSWQWNIFVAALIALYVCVLVFATQRVLFDGELRELLLKIGDAVLLFVLAAEIGLRYVSCDGVPLSFVLANKNRVVLFASLILACHLSAQLLGYETPAGIIEGMLIGVLFIRALWPVPVLFASQPIHSLNSDEPVAARCVHILDRVKHQIAFGLDTEIGVSILDVDFVTQSIASNTVQQSSLDVLLEAQDDNDDTTDNITFSINNINVNNNNTSCNSNNSSEGNNNGSNGNNSNHNTGTSGSGDSSAIIDKEQTSFLRHTFTSFNPSVSLLAPPDAASIQRRHSFTPDPIATNTTIGVSDEAAKLMRDVGEWHFDVFAAASLSHNQPLLLVASHVFARLQLPSTFNIPEHVLNSWLKRVESGYRPNPYHSSTHAADVVQCAYYMLSRTGLLEVFSDIEVLAVIVAAVIHDYGHVGLTNVFLKLTSHKLAIRYNDQCILENFHASEGWQLCMSDDHPLLQGLAPDQLRAVRDLVLDLVLNTDMARHSGNGATFATKLATGLDLTRAEDRLIVLRTLLHVADLSNGARNSSLSHKWSRCVMDEFFNQGDQEKEVGVSVSPNMDRDGGEEAVAKCQFTFLHYVIKPLFKDWCAFLRKHCLPLAPSQAERSAFLFETHVGLNIERWEQAYHQLCPAAAKAAKEQRKTHPKTPLVFAKREYASDKSNQQLRARAVPKLAIDDFTESDSFRSVGVASGNGSNGDMKKKSSRSKSLEPSSEPALAALQAHQSQMKTTVDDQQVGSSTPFLALPASKHLENPNT